MSDTAQTSTAAEAKDDTAAQAVTPSSSSASVDPVQATVTQPEVADTVNLSVKPEVEDHSADVIVVAVAAVDNVQQDNVQLTAVPATNQSVVQGQPTVPSQPTVQNLPTVPSQPTVQSQPTVPSQPTIQNQPTVQNQPTAPAAMQTTFKTQPDDFYRTIFYFSGMGRVIGSALAEGVYVDEKNRGKAIDPDEINLYTKGSSSSAKDAGSKSAAGPSVGEPQLITSARNQAVNLSADFRRLQTLLESLPTFTDADQSRSSVTGGGVKVDEPIHGEIYFRSERPEQYQQQQQQQLQQQRMRQQQLYIMDQNPSAASYQNMNGHLINNVPWNYTNSGY